MLRGQARLRKPVPLLVQAIETFVGFLGILCSWISCDWFTVGCRVVDTADSLHLTLPEIPSAFSSQAPLRELGTEAEAPSSAFRFDCEDEVNDSQSAIGEQDRMEVERPRRLLSGVTASLDALSSDKVSQTARWEQLNR